MKEGRKVVKVVEEVKKMKEGRKDRRKNTKEVIKKGITPEGRITMYEYERRKGMGMRKKGNGKGRREGTHPLSVGIAHLLFLRHLQCRHCSRVYNA